MGFGDRMAPFKAADGLAFFTGVSPYKLAGGRYGSGEGALVVVCVDGEVECKLTVSLANYGAPKLNAGEFYVRIGEDSDAASAKIRRSLLDLGAFAVAGEPIAQGHVERYAVAWRFVVCEAPDHPGRGTEHVVECVKCRARIAAEYAAGKTRLLATDAVKIIKRMGKAEQW